MNQEIKDIHIGILPGMLDLYNRSVLKHWGEGNFAMARKMQVGGMEIH